MRLIPRTVLAASVVGLLHAEKTAMPEMTRSSAHLQPPLASCPRAVNVGITKHRPLIRRNDPCPCGSGKKFKTCHLPK